MPAFRKGVSTSGMKKQPQYTPNLKTLKRLFLSALAICESGARELQQPCLT